QRRERRVQPDAQEEVACGHRPGPGKPRPDEVERPDRRSRAIVDVEPPGELLEDPDPGVAAHELGALAELLGAARRADGRKRRLLGPPGQVEHGHVLVGRGEDELVVARARDPDPLAARYPGLGRPRPERALHRVDGPPLTAGERGAVPPDPMADL